MAEDMLFCISATEDPLNPSGTKPGWMLHQINAIINMVTHRGKCREPAIALVTPECRWPECQEGIPLWNEAFLSLIQALPILMCQGRDTEQGHGCCAQWIRAKWISTRPKARAKPFAPSAPLKCQEFLMALVMGCTGQLPNHHRTLPRQSRVKIIGQQQGIMDTRQKKGFQTSTSKILRKTAPKHVCCYTQEWLLGESKPTNCLWITEPWRKALCTRNSGRQAAKWSRKQQWKQGPSSDTGGNSCLHLCINISRTDSKLSQGFSYIPFHVSPSQRCWSVLSSVWQLQEGKNKHIPGAENSQTACWPHCSCCSWVFPINADSESSGLGCVCSRWSYPGSSYQRGLETRTRKAAWLWNGAHGPPLAFLIYNPIQLCPGKWPPGFSHSLTSKAGAGEMKPELPMKPIPCLL